jgi:hypothetical protein
VRGISQNGPAGRETLLISGILLKFSCESQRQAGQTFVFLENANALAAIQPETVCKPSIGDTMPQPIKSTLPEQPTRAPSAARTTGRAANIEPTVSARILEIRHTERERAGARRSRDAISIRATEAFEQIGGGLSDSYRWAARQTAEGLRRARLRVRHLCSDYPLHVVAGVAGTAFVMGIVLRLGRSSHD